MWCDVVIVNCVDCSHCGEWSVCQSYSLVRTAAHRPDFYSLQAILEVAAGQVQAEIAVTVLQAAPL